MEYSATGVFPANVTARASDGSVDLKQTKAVIEFLYSKGVDGLHALGSTGEFATLSIDQRKAAAEAAIEAANGRGTVMIHVGTVNTDDARDLARHAAKAGADAISSVPPYYYRATRASALNHYRAIREASGLPVVIYDNPGTTGFTVDVELARLLAEEDTAHGMKVARQDMYSFARLGNICGGKFVLYPVETFYVAGLATAPMVGTIGSVSNWFPEPFVGMKRNFEAGNIERAGYLQRLVCEVIGPYIEDEIPATKALLEYRGVPCGDSWEPQMPLSNERRDEVIKAIEGFNLDFDDLAKVK